MPRALLPLLAFVTLLPLSAAAADRAATERAFDRWLDAVVWPLARADGIGRETYQRSLGEVTLDWDLPGLDLPHDGGPAEDAQVEFGAPARYFRQQRIDDIVRAGRRKAATHRATLDRVAAATGVPAHILLAIWGRETGFGGVRPRQDAFRVLAARGFFGPDGDYFTGELVAALGIVQDGLSPDGPALLASWAGAMGQPQFMPTSFRAYGADGDGDGRVDIWNSAADSIASIASFLALHDWVPGRDWGFEVRLPDDVSCTLEGPDRGRPISDWAAMGVTRVSGRPFPAPEAAGVGFLMLPAGRLGPAFVVTPNFHVLKRYNQSDLYALYIGHVGDRIAYDMGAFRAAWRPLDRLLRSDIRTIQAGLAGMGHDVGGVDGLPGFKTRRSIGRWQEAQGEQATCFPDRSLVTALSR